MEGFSSIAQMLQATGPYGLYVIWNQPSAVFRG